MVTECISLQSLVVFSCGLPLVRYPHTSGWSPVLISGLSHNALRIKKCHCLGSIYFPPIPLNGTQFFTSLSLLSRLSGHIEEEPIAKKPRLDQMGGMIFPGMAPHMIVPGMAPVVPGMVPPGLMPGPSGYVLLCRTVIFMGANICDKSNKAS